MPKCDCHLCEPCPAKVKDPNRIYQPGDYPGFPTKEMRPGPDNPTLSAKYSVQELREMTTVQLAEAHGMKVVSDPFPSPPRLGGPQPVNAPGAQKDDSGKRPWGLFPWEAAGIVVDVLRWGAYQTPRPDGSKGYGANNWQGVASDRYFDAAIRHLTDWKKGERLDPLSKLPHLAHAACCALFMLWQTEVKK